MPAAYDEGHIPGALLWDAYQDLRHPDYSPIDADELNAAAVEVRDNARDHRCLLRLCPVSRLLADGPPRPRGIRLMEGPRERWEDAGHPLSTDVPEPASSSYERRGRSPSWSSGGRRSRR